MLYSQKESKYSYVEVQGAESNQWLLVSSNYSTRSTLPISGVPRNFVQGGGVEQIQLRTEDRENGDLGVVAP